jgi:hypothetical protein
MLEQFKQPLSDRETRRLFGTLPYEHEPAISAAGT